tara:strand:- start:187 stop:339 length:153 start_codon:yes stop_codon:yes gene_type:complete
LLIKVAHQYVLWIDKIKIWGYGMIFVDIVTKTTVFVIKSTSELLVRQHTA